MELELHNLIKPSALEMGRRTFMKLAGAAATKLRYGWDRNGTAESLLRRQVEREEDPNFVSEPKGEYYYSERSLDLQAELAKVSFSAEQNLTMTYFFMWYDEEEGLHMKFSPNAESVLDRDGGMKLSYENIPYLKKQIEDILIGRVDVILPVSWDLPHKDHQESYWSEQGLYYLVQAMEELEAEYTDEVGVAGANTLPQIGMMYDTNSFAAFPERSEGGKVDIRDPYYRKYFAKAPVDFFSFVPVRFWAAIDGKPIITTYSAEHVDFNQSSIDQLHQVFGERYQGIQPYLILKDDWGRSINFRDNLRNGKVGGVYQWGGANNRVLRAYGSQIASIGPGFNEEFAERGSHRITDRENGLKYALQWIKILRDMRIPGQEVKIVLLETWNEKHEETQLEETISDGRFYIELTQVFTRFFRLNIPVNMDVFLGELHRLQLKHNKPLTPNEEFMRRVAQL